MSARPTITAVAAGVAINPSLYREVKYDPLKDFAPITQGIAVPNILIVHPSVAAASVKELIALAQARPGQLAFASAGNAGIAHLSGELLKYLTSIDMTHVPYKGTAAAVTDLLSGQVSLTFSSAVSVMPHVKAGRLRGLAVTTLVLDLRTSELRFVRPGGYFLKVRGTVSGFPRDRGQFVGVLLHLAR